MAKWPYIGNAVFRIVQNHGEKVTILGGAIAPFDPRLIRPWSHDMG